MSWHHKPPSENESESEEVSVEELKYIARSRMMYTYVCPDMITI